MFGLFGKKEAAAPEERLASLQSKKDWAGLVKAYYELGTAAMEQGDLNHAQLWLHRADTIYSASDAVYEKVGDKLIDDCSDRIGALEEEGGLLYNSLPAQIEEKAEELLRLLEERLKEHASSAGCKPSRIPVRPLNCTSTAIPVSAVNASIDCLIACACGSAASHMDQ